MMRNQSLKRRGSRHYTVWIAREGRKPVVMAFRPVVVTLAIGLPIIAIVGLAFSFIHQNSQLNRRNLELTEEAADILEQLESLETTITTLQERAGMAEDDVVDAELDAEDGGYPFGDEFEADGAPDRTQTFEEFEEIEKEPEDENFDFRGEEGVEWFGRNRSQSSQGGVGVRAAEELLAIARSKLPHIVQELEGEVEPALAEIILREEAKPKGVPLTAADTEITSLFGFRSNPFGWGYEFHEGMDFVAAYGSPIYVTAAGTVEKAEWEPGYGNYVVVNHGYGYQTLYAHLSEIKVKAGEQIDRRQIVGYLGNTGRSSGPHLHYTVFQNEQAVDPKKYLD